ncbi:hypothetical protein BB561_003567 [Smittium simulii]|uniref:Bestrophin homolog n=1 Tax=Smittium simulii TaxID=133385 RepID=A0A2T9YKM1_9FUNG|nr:hypothetical protein BB561_003567 [Smittium simulii]
MKRQNSAIFSERRYIFSNSRFSRIFPLLSVSTIYCIFVGYITNIHGKPSLPPNTLMGLLLAFRTNTAYDRYWEGRKVWGTIEELSINLMRNLKYTVKIKDEMQKQKNQQALKNVVALPYAVRFYLLGKPDYVSQELLELLSPEIKGILHTKSYGSIISVDNYNNTSLSKFSSSNTLNSIHNRVFNTSDLNLPHRVTYELTEYIDSIPSECVKPQAYSSMLSSINALSGACISCLRIQTTPMPIAYSSHLYQSLYLYLLFLPFSMLGYNYYIMGMIQFMVTFMLFGALDIAEEIEDPFGEDANDLQIGKFCGNLFEEYKFICCINNQNAQDIRLK